MWQLGGGYSPGLARESFSSHMTLTSIIKFYVLNNYKILFVMGLYACSRIANTLNVKSESAIHTFQNEHCDSI